jgi:hypothetical protein
MVPFEQDHWMMKWFLLREGDLKETIVDQIGS